MADSLRDWVRDKGYLMACADPGVLTSVRAELAERRRAGELAEDFYRANLDQFSYGTDAALPEIRTLIVLAIPRPAHRLVFELEDGQLAAIIPPTYVFYRRTAEKLRDELAPNLPAGSSAALLNAPLKAIAARLGLVRYGRNNITYAPGLGSYHQLVGILTDADLAPLSGTAMNSYPLMPECDNCQACLKACPAGAIRRDRILLDAERCLTLLNENAGPWPAWLPASVHHCLVGCLACQSVCPANRDLFRYEEITPGFSAAETARILAGPAGEDDPAWRGIRAKLAGIGLFGYEDTLARNLGALIANRGEPGPFGLPAPHDAGLP
ncbi:MAG: 4Fe-4S double cluster binding domain-containing protein [Patescibacteria group bacterium]